MRLQLQMLRVLEVSDSAPAKSAGFEFSSVSARRFFLHFALASFRTIRKVFPRCAVVTGKHILDAIRVQDRKLMLTQWLRGCRCSAFHVQQDCGCCSMFCTRLHHFAFPTLAYQAAKSKMLARTRAQILSANRTSKIQHHEPHVFHMPKPNPRVQSGTNTPESRFLP